MPTLVQIDGVGEVEFPDSMTPDQITQTIRTKILAPKTETKTATPKPSFLQSFAANQPTGAPGIPVPKPMSAEQFDNPLIPTEPLSKEEKAGLAANLSSYLQMSGHPYLATFVAGNPEFIGAVNELDRQAFDFIDSPKGATVMGLGALGKGAQTVIAAMFAKQGIENAPEQYKALKKAIKEGDPDAASQAVLGLTADVEMGLGGVKAVKDAVPKPKAVQVGEAIQQAAKEAPLQPPKEPTPIVRTGQPSELPAQGQEIAARGKEAAQLPGGAAELAAQDVPRAIGDMPKIAPATAIGGARVEGLEAELGELHKQLQAAKISGDGELISEIRGRMEGISRELLGLRNVGLENLEGGLPTAAQLGTFETKGTPRGSSNVTYRNPPSTEALPEANQPESTPISQPPPQTKTSTPVVAPGTTEQRTAAESPLTSKDLEDTTKDLNKEFGQEGGTSEGLSVGPGAASPAEMTGPPIAEAHIGNPDVPPPARASVPWHQAITDVFKKVGTTMKAMAGETMPKTTAVNREVGEAGARYLSSSLAARPLAHDFATHTVEGTGVDPVKFGAALVEDNLRSVRDEFRAKATEALTKGKQEEADALFAKADEVRSLIGAKNFPFKTEDEFQDFLAEKPTKQAVANHIQQWNEIIEPQYKQARMLDPDIELPSRGLQTGARVNLKAIQPGIEEALVSGIQVPESGKLTGTMRKKTPFAIRAKGTGNIYEISYPELIANTFTKQLELANKNAFDRALVESGNAVIEKPGWKGTIADEPVVSYPLTRGPFQGKNIYVRKSLAGEYETASNVYRRVSLGKLTPILNTMNSVALKSLTEFSVHTGNLMTALFNAPISSKLWLDQVLSAPGLHLPYRGLQVVHKLWESFKDAGAKNQTQLADLAKIGALRPSGGSGLGGRMIHTLDTTVRLLLDDTYKGLAEKGILPNTETARREFVNQVGQYNKRAQGPVVRALRESGVGPFATAGRAFTTMGVRMATFTPAVRGATPLGQAMLRASILSKWLGGISIVTTLNAITTGKAGGRTGTPVGYIDTGLNGKDGKPLIFPFFDMIGLGRALRVTGIAGAVNTQRLGLTIGDSANAAARDILNSLAGVAAGPGTRAISVGATGRAPAMQVNRVSPVVQPGKNQITRNIREAAEDLNPLVKSALTIARGKPVSEALSQQLPRFTLRSGKPSDLTDRYPQIVRLAQTYAFADNLVGRARQEPKDKRWDFVYKEMEGMPMDEQKIVLDQLRRRKVFQ